MELKIAEPCHENWEAMTPQEAGKHCAVCTKTVHDFTGRPKEELLAFLLCSEQRPCIRMLATQQHFTPEEVQSTAKKLLHSGIKIPAAAMALVMLLATGSCTTSGNENTAGPPADTAFLDDTLKTDSAAIPPDAMGMVIMPPVLMDTPQSGKANCVNTPPEVLLGEPVAPLTIQGDVSIVDPQPTMGIPPHIEPLVVQDSTTH